MPESVNSILDQTLPPELQKVVKTLAEEGTPTAPANETQVPAREETKMPADLTENQVAHIASQAAIRAAEDLLKQKDAQQAVANRIAALESERDVAKAATTRTAEELATANKNIEGLKAQLVTLTDSGAKAEAKVADLTQKLEAATKGAADLQVQVNKANADKAVASRVQKLTEAGLATAERVEKLTATQADGTFKIGNDAFEQIVADLKAAYDAGAEAAKKKTDHVPQTDDDEDADKDPKDGKDGKKDGKGGKTCSQASAAAPAAPAAPVTPAAPDLSQVDQYTAATAALISGASTQPTATGVTGYAKMFGALQG